jgi:hypothetical protein
VHERLGATLQTGVDGRLDHDLARRSGNERWQSLQHGIDRVIDARRLALLQIVGKADRAAIACSPCSAVSKPASTILPSTWRAR